MTRVLLAATCLAVALVALAGCGANPDALRATEKSLEVAETAGTIYRELPLCPRSDGRMCGDPVIRDKIAEADNIAYAAVLQMRAGKATPAEVSKAIADLVALIPVKAR